MKFHIVGNGESIRDILDGYEITFEELKNENKHIRVWNQLIPGTKLKIPVLTEALVEELNEIEPFIEDYYPKIQLNEEQFSIIEDAIENNEEDLELDDTLVECENEVIEEEQEQKEEKIESQTNIQAKENKVIDEKRPMLVRYVYPFPCYYRPIVYVIPRK